MDKNDKSTTQPGEAAEEENTGQSTVITVDDLLTAESEVLRRIAGDVVQGPETTAHNSFTSGHKAGGGHSSHTSHH